MAFANAQIFLLLAVFSSLFPIGLADFNWGPRSWSKTNCPYTTEHPPNVTQTSNKFVVGGSEDWHYGFNYRMDWARKCAPFFVNDTLGAKRIADPTEGAGEGFEFVLNKMRPYYFACGENEGVHCKTGNMKFFVIPLKHRST
ncbi:uncharacterized protein LOC132051015 isoform X2 [Lycium ferocissimum]|uniref:uncharacterized protein LOC132051015 isoform X2 n=1 Tax=Lycium ferocissimum TaxID=112874 RepID=UPI002815C730|nr:uncharacterized protein LOC132051015 isoform X2 [Lycium ferocissimum]